MKLIVLCAFVMALESFAFAEKNCDAKLELSCQIHYLSQGQVVNTITGVGNFAQSNDDEPSLSRCASEVYIQNVESPDTFIRVAAEQDVTTGTFRLIASASQWKSDSEKSDRVYSNTLEANANKGSTTDMGDIQFVKSMKLNGFSVNRASVICTIR